MMLIRMLLKSCATPPASCPIASSFCDWRSCASSARRSVTSRTKTAVSAGIDDPIRAARSQPGQLELTARAGGRADVVAQRTQAAGPRRRRKQDLEAPPENVHPPRAEHLLGRGIELANQQP